MRNLLILLITTFVIVLVACSDGVEKKANNDDEHIRQETEKEKKLNKKIDINETLEFEQFNIEFNKAKAYEKKDKLLLDIHFDWKNKRLPDGSTLYVATLLEIKQGDHVLNDINDHWNPEGDRGLQNDVFMNTSVGSSQPVKLTYELMDKEDEIRLTFTPTSETEEGKIITIDIE